MLFIANARSQADFAKHVLQARNTVLSRPAGASALEMRFQDLS